MRPDDKIGVIYCAGVDPVSKQVGGLGAVASIVAEGDINFQAGRRACFTFGF